MALPLLPLYRDIICGCWPWTGWRRRDMPAREHAPQSWPFGLAHASLRRAGHPGMPHPGRRRVLSISTVAAASVAHNHACARRVTSVQRTHRPGRPVYDEVSSIWTSVVHSRSTGAEPRPGAAPPRRNRLHGAQHHLPDNQQDDERITSRGARGARGGLPPYVLELCQPSNQAWT